MRIILVTWFFLLAGNVWAENPVNLSGVTLDYTSMLASAGLIATGFGLALLSFKMGIQYMKWVRESASPVKPRPQSQQGPPDHY